MHPETPTRRRGQPTTPHRTRRTRNAGRHPRGLRSRAFLCALTLNLAVAYGIASRATAAEIIADTDAPSDYDPWQPFNETMFVVNHDALDRYVLKPVATGWRALIPEVARRGLDRAFDNIAMPKRFVNSVLQGRLIGASREIARFAVNTTVGVVGFIDVAQSQLHLEASDADTGQTLGVYGVGPGPYLVLPTLPPLTVRDGIGYGVDGFLDPLGQFTPLLAAISLTIVQRVNERSLNLDWFQDVEDTALDLYSAVRNAYLQRRQRSIEHALAARRAEWRR